MKVADLIASRRDVYFITKTSTVHDAARYLRDKQVRAVGVCDQHGVLLGVVSQSDVSDKVAAENKCPAWMRVSEIMTRQLVSTTPETLAGRLFAPDGTARYLSPGRAGPPKRVSAE